MRRISSMVLGLVLVMGSALPAGAQPEVHPPEEVEPLDFVFDAGFPCDYPLGVLGGGKEGGVFFDDRGVLTAPGFHVTLTNMDNENTRTYRIPGVWHETYLDDGTILIKAVGPNIFFGLFEGEPGMFLTKGKVMVETTDYESFTFLEEGTTGSIVDVCAQLG